MTFDVVIGNPPYQESNGGGNGSSAGTLYDKFIVNAIDVTEQIVCMITKNNWMASDTLKTTRDKMVANKITNIINYPIVGEVFKGVDVAVSIVMLNKKSSYDTLFQEVKNTEIASEYKADFRNMPCITSSEYEYTIIKKVFTPNNFSNHIIAKLPFGIETNGKLGSTGNAPFIDESEISTDYYNIALMYMDKKSTYFSYTALDCIPKNIDIVPHYKIICGQQLNKNGNTITNINGLSSNQICSGSFSLLYSNSKKECAYRAYKYICSKFFRMLTNIMVDNMCRVSPVRFILIPEQDFTVNSDIDWSQSINITSSPEDIVKDIGKELKDCVDKSISAQLYRKYLLSPEEIEYIESTIKPMS